MEDVGIVIRDLTLLFDIPDDKDSVDDVANLETNTEGIKAF
jgi:hypothetical protein